MAPSGNITFSEMTIPVVYAPFLSTLTSSSSHERISSALFSIHSDHDYFMKPQVYDIGHRLANSQEFCDFLDCDNSCGSADVMLSCNIVDFHKVTGDNQDADFLTDLGELDFDIGDLDPCSDVEMEDSFQEFIDSALEESAPPFLFEGFNTDHLQQHDDVTATNVTFFAKLGLVPVQTNHNTDEIWSLSLESGSSESQNTTFTQDNLPAISPTVASKDTTSIDTIPTKMCSYLEPDSSPKAVYSTAHANHEDSVSICQSSVFTRNNECSNCKGNKQIPDRFMSPLFIDTSLTTCSGSFPPLSDDHHHVEIDRDQLSEVDKDTSDIMKWLKDNQQAYQLQDDNNNSVDRNGQNGAITFTETSSTNGAITFTETSSQKSRVVSETFIDLDDFLNKAGDRSMEHTDFNHYCQGTTNQPHLKNKDVCHSHLKLSFLEELPERSWDDGKLKVCSYSDISCEGLTHDSLSSKSSHFSQCSSPAWSVPDSAQSSPLGSMNVSLSSDWENVFEDSCLKSQLALLKLFSEENAESLFVTDLPEPRARFV